MKSEFVSNVSHELKTPLALIRMFSETLLMGRVKNDERKIEYYDVITRESERLTALINNVLDFSKIDAGRRTYDMAPASVEEVVKNTLAAYRYELSKENFDVEVAIEDDLPVLVMDDDAISQALLNLLNNAVKYSGDHKYIKVSAFRRDGTVHIAVTDKGLGISKEDQKKIFDMFYRGADAHVRPTRGTGLGLAITKHTAEAHGGTVLLESARGDGSTFTIVLPLEQSDDGDGTA
jgi:signal transduction histidine kinase